MSEFAQQQQLTGAAWEVAGRRVSSSLDAASSVLVVGEDATAAAHAALGIARVQAARRRVALADLVGDAPPLQELVSGDDAHGITDSFQYGVSLSRIARRVDEAGSLFVLSSGSEPEITEKVLRSERWAPFIDSYAKAGALLLFVAPSHASGLDALARYLDGAVLVGDAATRAPGDVRVLAVVAAPPAERSMSPDAPPLAAVTGADRPAQPSRTVGPERRSRVPMIVGGVLAAAAAGWLLLPRLTAPPSAGDGAPRATMAAPASPTAALPGTPGAAGLSGNATSAGTGGSGPLAFSATASNPSGGLAVSNPADSANASIYAVLVSTFPTAERARLRIQQDSPEVPAGTVAAVQVPAGQRHQYLAGAYSSRADADTLLRRLRRRAVVGARGGSVVQRPLAFLVRDRVPRDSVQTVTRSLARRGLPVYALVQHDGSIRLYTGAFVTSEQAALAVGSLRRLGVAPTLAYRVGRPL